MTHLKRAFLILLICTLVLSTLGGCTTPDKDISSKQGISGAMQSNPIPSDGQAEERSPSNRLNASLSPLQSNSLNMLNHMVMLTQEVNASQNNRMYLEMLYSELYNNTNPESVDSRALTQIKHLLDTMEEYRMASVKRERLKYIYDQQQAEVMRKAIPDPLAVLNAVQSFSIKRIVSSILYMGVNSYTNYQNASDNADMEYLKGGWELDEEAAAALHAIHKDTFEYIVETVQDYGLPGKLALNEEAVSEFVKWKNKTNTAQKIQFFEANEETYRASGDYWLTLAQCYYEAGDYEACLQAIDAYEALNIAIFRKDYALAEVLPMAIVAARDIMRTEKYIETAERYVKLMLDNSANSAWALRYVAAQTKLELYALTNQKEYLTQAYDILLNNINELVEEQKRLNEVYLAEIQTVEISKKLSKTEKKELQQYNELLRQTRLTELPPVYEPLLLNCELVFALMDKVDAGRQQRTYDILYSDGKAVFLLKPLDDLYSDVAVAKEEVDIQFSKHTLTLPAQYVSEDATILVTVSKGEEVITFEDWTIQKVERKTAGDIASFMATYTSKEAKEFRYTPDMDIHIEVISKAESSAQPVCSDFKTVERKHLWVISEIVVEQVE